MLLRVCSSTLLCRGTATATPRVRRAVIPSEATPATVAARCERRLVCARNAHAASRPAHRPIRVNCWLCDFPVVCAQPPEPHRRRRHARFGVHAKPTPTPSGRASTRASRYSGGELTPSEKQARNVSPGLSTRRPTPLRSALAEAAIGSKQMNCPLLGWLTAMRCCRRSKRDTSERCST